MKKATSPHFDMQLISREKAAHWYGVKDNVIVPMYEVPRADGKGMRATNLSDARKCGFLIGISSVAGVLPKPALTAWLQEQAIMAALTLPRLPDEAMDAFAKRAIEDMQAQSTAARDFGSQIHQGIEDYLNGMSSRTAGHIKDFLQDFYTWADENIGTVHDTEQVVGDSTLGIAGKLDADVTIKGIGNAIVDFKTQGIKNGKPTFYSEWLPQLSAYEHCIRREDNIPREVVSIVINSTKHDVIHVNHWLGAKELGWAIFQHCLEIWKYINNFDPSHHQPKETND